jgi:SagB-type dehydrogenase family enzyme
MNDKTTAFDEFWELSSLDVFNLQSFAQQMNAYDSEGKELLLSYPEAPRKLPRPRTRLNTITKKRRSVRDFSGNKLSEKDLGRIFSSFYAWNGLEHRAYPSAGANYATEIYGIAFHTKKHEGAIVYYDPEKHGLVQTGRAAPAWDEARTTLNITVRGEPSLLVIFVLFSERVTSKYGERGGRFALLEVGAAIQQLSLQIADSSRLHGVIAGGLLDYYWKNVLGLSGTEARIVIGYLVGV